MSGFPFQFAVLRYVHDPVTQEFLNVGVVVYSPAARYVRAVISMRYARLACAFLEIDGEHYHRVVGHLGRRLENLRIEWKQYGLFEPLPQQVEVVLGQVLPPDDSSLVFGGYGGGIAEDLDAALNNLFNRLVQRYIESEEPVSRTEQEVWQVYRQEFDRHNITGLVPVTIGTEDYKYDFDHAWKNKRWHPMEPVSFDLLQPTSVLEKANRWIGRMANLADSGQIGTLFMLLGLPRREEVQEAYHKAVRNLQRKKSLELVLVEESQAAVFSAQLARMMGEHQET